MTISKLAVAGLVAAAVCGATSAAAPVPFRLGTFGGRNGEFLGLVLKDGRVLDISAANEAFEKGHPAARRIRFPPDMRELIARYEQDLGVRLEQIAAANVDSVPRAPRYSHRAEELKVLPPVRPTLILNAGANYPEHAEGIIAQAARAAAATGQPSTASAPGRPVERRPAESSPGLWDHPPTDARPDNPYLFLKSPSVVVGADDDVVVPKGREEIDWECEFAVVIGRSAKNVSVADAPNYIFGYSIEFDVSDRQGRGDRKMGGGPDWFVQKNHDTFAPIGPYIVPKEFLPDPMNTRHYFTLNGEVKQDANTSRMEYNIWEMLAYASNVLTLHPGDLISMGTPPGTNIEKSNPRWMRAGDMGVCTVEGIGEQHHHIVDQK